MAFTREDDSFFLSNEILIIVFVYTLSYGLTLLNTGLYLDDFVMTGFYQNPAHVLGAYSLTLAPTLPALALAPLK